MISIENDKEIFEADYPAIVPFLLQEQNGEVYIEAYSGIEDIAVQYELRFENEYFSDAALRWLNANIQSYLDIYIQLMIEIIHHLLLYFES